MNNEALILKHLQEHPRSSSREIHDALLFEHAYVTTRRTLDKLLGNGFL